MVISPTWWRELLYFLKVFRTAFGSYISQSNYTRGEFSCLLLSTVGCGECFLSVLFTGSGCGVSTWSGCSDGQRHSALCWRRRGNAALCGPCVSEPQALKKKENNVKYEQVFVCVAGARNCSTPLSLSLSLFQVCVSAQTSPRG